MSRESTTAKAARYLVEGRLIVSHVQRGGVSATCRGDGTIYELGWRPASGWSCTCPARGRCSHLIALGHVTAVDLEPPNDRRPTQ